MSFSFITVALASILSLIHPIGMRAEQVLRQILILGSAEESAVSLWSEDAQVPQNQRDWVHAFTQVILEERLKSRLGEETECHLLKDALPSCLLISEREPYNILKIARSELRDLSFSGPSLWELNRAKEMAREEIAITSQEIQEYIVPLYIHVDEEMTSFRSEEKTDYIQCALSEDIAPFYNLPISETDKHYIREVFHAIAKYNVVKLGLKNREIRKKGDKFDHLHPLRFWSYLVGEGGMRGDLQKIRSNSWKWNNVSDNFIKRLNRYADAGDMMRYVPGFAHSLGADQNEIRYIIERRDWNALMNYFL